MDRQREVERRRVATAGVARLATVDPGGWPHLVPCAFVLAEDTIEGGAVRETVYSAVDEKPKTTLELARLRNLEHDPRAALLIDHYEDDWSRLWWIRLRGRGRVLRNGAERDRGLDLLAEKYAQYRDDRPRGPVIAIDVEDWRSWEAAPTNARGQSRS